MIDFDKEREAFEEWENSIGSNIAKRGLEYVNDRTASEWFSWGKRAALAQQEINDLKQQLSEAHASRASWVEYSQKVESGEFVLVPRNANDDMWESGWREFEISESMHKAYKAMIEASQQPTNFIDSFIASGGFDKAMGGKNGE